MNEWSVQDLCFSCSFERISKQTKNQWRECRDQEWSKCFVQNLHVKEHKASLLEVKVENNKSDSSCLWCIFHSLDFFIFQTIQSKFINDSHENECREKININNDKREPFKTSFAGGAWRCIFNSVHSRHIRSHIGT